MKKKIKPLAKLSQFSVIHKNVNNTINSDPSRSTSRAHRRVRHRALDIDTHVNRPTPTPTTTTPTTGTTTTSRPKSCLICFSVVLARPLEPIIIELVIEAAAAVTLVAINNQLMFFPHR